MTNKTVSRWENGNYLPPVEMLLELSKLYDVSLNELLSGERIQTESAYRERAEENIRETLFSSVFTKREVYLYFRKKWLKDHLFEHILYPVLLLSAFVCGAVWGKEWLICLAGVGTAVVTLVERNFYRAYMEKHLYDGSGNPVVDDRK